MKPLQHLWPAIESVPGLKAVEAEWAYRLATEHDSLRPYLVVTNELATCYPALDQGEPRPIVAHAADDFAAICPAGGVAIALRRTDVLVHRFDGMRLARAVATALNTSGSSAPVAGDEMAWRIGTLPVDLGARPVYMAIPSESAALVTVIDTIAAAGRQPFLLLAPTRRWVSAAVESRLEAVGGTFFALCDLLHLGADGHFRIPASVTQALGTMLGVQSAAGAAANIFQRQGDKWVVSFEGETIYPTESVGLIYIARLLAEPHREIPAVTLLATRAGIDPRIASGSSGKILTDETRKNYMQRYQDLQSELQEANSRKDLGRVEKLENEMAQLIGELESATGLGGRAREKSDAERVRKRVSMAVSRGIDKITKHHASLGRHLTVSITSGLTFRYAPEHDPNWLT